MSTTFQPFEEKMRASGMGELAIETFRRHFAALSGGGSGLIREEEIEPGGEVEGFEEADGAGPDDAELLGRTVVVKLNGGLGTSMGLSKAKSLLPLRDGLTFLDLIVRQVESLRGRSGANVRLLLMNSFATSKDTMGWLAEHAAGDLADPGEVEMMQNRVPKIDAATMGPVEWPPNPALEWCPPGHGDIYPVLAESGWLDRLLSEGVRYAFVSNSDNLGATLSPGLLAHFAASGAPFMMEVTRRTGADRKGGHLARRLSDGRLLLREVAQCAPEDLDAFQDTDRYRYFNTNNIWLRLDALRETLDAHGGVLPLPVIRNRKTVDPRDKGSTPVIQLEAAMGAAIECFDASRAIEVGRGRFAPVKTSADLLAVRSDAYRLAGDGRLELEPGRQGVPPVVELDARFRMVDALDGLGLPSLLGCRRLDVEGAVEFGPGVVVEGDVSVKGEGVLGAGVYRDCEIEL